MKVVKVWLIFWLMMVLLFSGLNSVYFAVATASSVGSDSLEIRDVVIDMEGYARETYSYNFSGWGAYLDSINIPHGSDYLSTGYSVGHVFCTPPRISPKDFLLLSYNNTQSGKTVYLEIYEYNSTEDARLVYSWQYQPASSLTEYNIGRGLIFQRFQAEQVLLYRDQFMIFIFCPTAQPETDTLAQSTLNDCTQKFADNLFNVLPGSTHPPPPPSVNFTGTASWGVKPGDSISWELNETLFTGYVGEGMSHSKTSTQITWEIVQVTDDNLSILIKSPAGSPSDFDYTSYRVPTDLSLVLPTHRYFWATVTDPPADASGWILIYPSYLEGQTLKDVIGSHTLCKDFQEDAEYVTGHYVTPKAEGYTPTETQWRDVTVHKGSGMVTAGSFYYNSNKYSITRSDSLVLKSKNFDLTSRVPYTPHQNHNPGTHTLSISETTENSIRIDWTPSTDDLFAKYEIYQSTSEGDLGTRIQTMTDRSTAFYTVAGLSANNTYYFTVRVVYADDSFTNYNQVSGTTQANAIFPSTQIPPSLIAGVAVAFAAVIVAALFLRRRKSLAHTRSPPTVDTPPPPPPPPPPAAGTRAC